MIEDVHGSDIISIMVISVGVFVVYLLALALYRYCVYAMGLFVVWGSGGRY